ncbi:conserved hypothetical protein [Gammaproteobacteria bacterium]
MAENSNLGGEKNLPTVEELKPVIELELLARHRGQGRRVEKWLFVETVCRVSIPEAERNNNNVYERRVRQAISEMRKDGKLICSDTAGGYWWATSIEDVLVMSKGLRDRAKDLLVTARRLRVEGKQQFGGQLRMKI